MGATPQDANVAFLIASLTDFPRAYICDGCIAVCNDVIEERCREPPKGAANA